MNANGIYRATYSVPGDAGEGLAFLDNGKIYGGDYSHVFFGTYSIEADNMTAMITRKQYARTGHNLGGGGNQIALTGKITANEIRATGKIQGSNMEMSITLEKIFDL